VASPPRAPNNPAWTTFLDAHPELEPEPLEFTDDELVAAVEEVARRLERAGSHYGAAGSADVADVLAKRLCDFERRGMEQNEATTYRICGPTLSDVKRVGFRLAYLARHGRIARYKAWSTVQWAPVGAVVDARLARLSRPIEDVPESQVLEMLVRAGRPTRVVQLVEEIGPPEGERQRYMGLIGTRAVHLRSRGLARSVRDGDGRWAWEATVEGRRFDYAKAVTP
jgi:hypothetical protein